jgi:hypothetical protein
MSLLPIVGARFHPPAQAILCTLPVGTELELLPEPTNPYDANAIMVYVSGEAVPASEELDSLASGYGTNSVKIRETPYHHLGYIPRGIAAQLAPFSATKGTFALSATGEWLVSVEV